MTLPEVVLSILAVAAISCGAPGSTNTPGADSASTPRFAIYYNSDASPLAATVDTSYTHVIVSFLRARVADDGAIELILPPKMDGQWGAVERVRQAGKRVLISFGGGEATAAEYGALAGREADLAAAVARFVKERGLDGVDIDFEASGMLHLDPAEGIADGRAFLIALTRHLRSELPAPTFEITHAPQPPYLSPGWHGGPYLDVLAAVGDEVDWISVQYYNNPGFDEPIADRVVGSVDDPWPTSYRGLVDPAGHLGWPSHKVVIGKPVYAGDTGNGLVAPARIAGEIIAPLCHDFGAAFGGLAGWEFSIGTGDNQYWNKQLPAALTAASCRKDDGS